MTEQINSISASWWEYFLPFIVLNSVFISIILFFLKRLKYSNIKLLNLIVLAGLFKLVLPVMNINPLSDTTLSNLTNYIYPEIIFRSTEAISADASMSAISIIFLTWIVGIILIAGLIIVNQIKIYGIISRSESMEVNGISYDIEVFRSAEIFSPFTTGLFRKRVLLPVDWNDISSECKKAVLAHEVAHVNNLDNWLNLIRRLIL
ncbi:MAG: hypothetical protein GY863_07525, partial [bacterium]|nr:hypothetical protein [bacterium]